MTNVDGHTNGAGLAALAAAVLRNDGLAQRAQPTLDSLAGNSMKRY
jgi:hypothetical protein